MYDLYCTSTSDLIETTSLDVPIAGYSFAAETEDSLMESLRESEELAVDNFLENVHPAWRKLDVIYK